MIHTSHHTLYFYKGVLVHRKHEIAKRELVVQPVGLHRSQGDH